MDTNNPYKRAASQLSMRVTRSQGPLLQSGSAIAFALRLLLPVFIGGLLIGLLVLMAFQQDGRLVLLYNSTCCLMISVGLVRWVYLHSKPLVTPTLVAASSVFQLSILTLYLLVSGDTVITSTFYFPDMSEYPILSTWPLLIVPSTTAVVVAAAGPFIDRKSYSLLLFDAKHNIIEQKRLGRLLILSAILMLLYQPAVVMFGFAGYFVRVLWMALALSPLVAGWVSHHDRKNRLIWGVSLLLLVLLSFVLGSRGTAFRSLGYFFIGRAVGAPGSRGIAFLRLGVIGLAVVIVFGFIGSLRNQIGRVKIDELSTQRVTRAVDTAGMQRQQQDASRNSNLQQGLVRLLVVQNMAVPILSKHQVAPIGYKGLLDEMRGYIDLSLFTGSTKRSRFEAGLGTIGATRYGFRVSTETNVPMPVLADGWSRGGIWGAWAFILITILSVIIMELLVFKLTVNYQAVRVMLVFVVGLLAFYNINSVPMLSLIRTLFLYVGFTWVVLLICSRIFDAVMPLKYND